MGQAEPGGCLLMVRSQDECAAEGCSGSESAASGCGSMRSWGVQVVATGHCLAGSWELYTGGDASRWAAGGYTVSDRTTTGEAEVQPDDEAEGLSSVCRDNFVGGSGANRRVRRVLASADTVGIIHAASFRSPAPPANLSKREAVPVLGT